MGSTSGEITRPDFFESTSVKTVTLWELFSSATHVGNVYSFSCRLKSALWTFVIMLIFSLVGVWAAHSYVFLFGEERVISVHSSGDESDFCYDVLPVREMRLGEMVVARSFKGSAWEAVLQEQVEREGKQFCYCRRYLIDGEKPNTVYIPRVSFVGSEAGRLSLAVFSIRRSRLMKILRSRGKHISLNPDNVPRKYSGAPFISSTSPIQPSDAFVLEYRTGETIESPLMKVFNSVRYDLQDVPEFANVTDLSFFKWPRNSESLTWENILCARILGFDEDIHFQFDCPQGHQSQIPPSVWKAKEKEMLKHAAEENDSFVSGIEVCSEYGPMTTDPMRRGVRQYNFIVDVAPLSFPPFGMGISLAVSSVVALGQFFFLKPWGKDSVEK